MKFQSVLLALSAVSAASAAACSKKPKPSSAAAYSPSIVASSAVASSAVASSVVYTTTSIATSSPVTSSPVASSTSSAETSSTSSAETSSTSSAETSSTSSAAASSTSSAEASENTSSSTGASSSSNTESSSSSVVSGEATFYGGNLSGGTCSFTTLDSIPNSLYGTAYSGAVWDNAAECGACVKVTGPDGNSITAMIVDECPECAEGHLDLFESAFLKLGTASEGIIDISYEFVSCGISHNIVLVNKSGTSAYWFSMQVVYANEAVESLEVSTDGGSTWQSTTRSSYNYFENSSGFGTDTVTVRVTSTSGSTVIVSDVSVSSEASATASSNFS